MYALKYIVVSDVSFMYKKSTCDNNHIDDNIYLMDVYKMLYRHKVEIENVMEMISYV